MDPVGPWSAYASYNRLAGVQPAAATDLHHPSPPTNSIQTPTTTTQILPGSFLSPTPVAYDVFSPIFHHAGAKPTSHYVSQHRQALAAANKTEGEYQTQVFFEQNAAWQQNSPFGILPHETIVPTTTGKGYENFNTHFAVQIDHLNSLTKNTGIRPQSPQVATPTTKPPPTTTFFQAPVTFSTVDSAPSNKSYPTTNIQQSCIVTSTHVASNPRAAPPQPRPVFLTTPNATTRLEKSFPPTKQPQIQTKAQSKVYPEVDRRGNGEEQQQSSPISFSLLDSQRVGFSAAGNQKRFPGNFRQYQSGDNENFRATNNGADCNVVVPRRPSPLQAHSQPAPLNHASSPAYPLYNSPMNAAITSPPTNNQLTPPTPLDVSVPRPQNNVVYSSVITRALNHERVNQSSCWDERQRKFANNNFAGNVEAGPRGQVGGVERQQGYFEQVTLQDLSSSRGDPMSIVKNLQQQQSCQVQQAEVKQEIKAANKRRKSSEKAGPGHDLTGRIPPPAHSTATNQPPQNGAYFDFDRWNLPPPPASKIFPSQQIPQHQPIMVPHPHPHHPAPLPYFPPFHLPPHPPEFQPEQITYTETPAQYQPDDQPKVVVPNIEEELNFLSEATPTRPTQPNKTLTHPIIAPVVKPPESKPNGPGVGFMSSYIKFLQGERDSSPPPPARGGRKQTWSRTKIISEKGESNGVPPTVPPPPPTIPHTRLSQGDPQDDPRYFPLPKERKQNTFDSSDDGISSDDDLFNKKVPPIAKEPVKEKTGRKGRPCKPGGPTERKRAKAAKLKREAEKLAGGIAEDESVPRRETSKRAAKEKIQLQSLAKTGEDEAEEPPEFADSDSDPAWTPAAKEEGEEEIPVKKGKRTKLGGRRKGTRNLITAAAQGAGIDEVDGYTSDTSCAQTKKQRAVSKAQKLSNNGNAAPTLEDNIAAAVAQQGDEDGCFKPGEFVVIRAELGQDWPAIWRVDGKTLLQKYEPFEQNGHTLYRNISTYTSWTQDNKKQYVTVQVKYRSQSHLETIVELLREDLQQEDRKAFERAMKESEAYQDNFEVYIQTLISQALDSNFLTEIFQEQDEYFLSNVKIIDDITIRKKLKIISLLKWPTQVQAAVMTWPCFNVITEGAVVDATSKCDACGKRGDAVRVLMYGQPYNSTTLDGCQPDPRAVNDKDFTMCRVCANRVRLFNKITHQKYLMYVECAKRVAEKRTSDPGKDTTCILNELLADEHWLSQLFRNVRSSWAEVDSIDKGLLHKNVL